jgi:hypothetical protein
VRIVLATRYVTPLREGGSLPAIVEGDDSGLYVVKFLGAGHGAKALAAEWVAGELCRAAGLRVPEIVGVEVGAALGRNEPDPEIRDLLLGSVGLNLGLDYLPGSVTFDPVAGPPPPAEEASEVVWLDAWLANVDRTARNPNLLAWHRRLWLIDHGSALGFHHAWDRADPLRTPAAALKGHVLLPWATGVAAAGERLLPKVAAAVAGVVGELPEAWLAGEPRFPSAAAHRAAYAQHLTARLAAAPTFAEEVARARAGLV